MSSLWALEGHLLNQGLKPLAIHLPPFQGCFCCEKYILEEILDNSAITVVGFDHDHKIEKTGS